MRHWSCIGVLLWLCVLASSAWAQVDGVENALSLLNTGKYVELEALYQRATKQKTRTRWGSYYSEEVLRHLNVSGAGVGEEWPAMHQRMQQWRAASPREQLPAIVHAHMLIHRAVDRDKKGLWRDASQLAGQARDALESVRAFAADDLNWHVGMLVLARIQVWEPERIQEQVRIALSVAPAAPTIQLAIGATFTLDPRTALQRLAWLARTAAEMTRGTDGMAMYAQVYLGATWWHASILHQPFGPGGMEWPTMDAALSDLQLRFPDSGALNNHAALACKAADWPRLAALLVLVGEQPQRAIWEAWGGAPFYDRCRYWAKEPADAPFTPPNLRRS